MFSFASLRYLQEVPDRVRALPAFSETVPWWGTALRGFGSQMLRALRLLWEEPEIAVFAAGQWVAAALAYALWSWGNELVLLPSEFWWLQDVLDFLWASACLALALWPIGFFTACIGAVHFLRMEGAPSTMRACMQRAQPRTGALWTLACVDAALHAIQVLARIPHGRYWTAERFIEREALHYAWKVGTIGMLPALLAERSLRQAADEAVALARARLPEAMLLRSGYNVAGRLITFASLAASAIAYWQLRARAVALPDFASGLFWLWAPVIGAIGVVHLLIRPVYVIASSELYHGYRAQGDAKPDAVAAGSEPGARLPRGKRKGKGRRRKAAHPS